MQIGTILTWNKEKRFGFIVLNSGGKNLFAHINDYSIMHKHWLNEDAVELDSSPSHLKLVNDVL